MGSFSEDKRKAKFFEKILFIPFHDCWEWGGEVADKGYGRFHLGPGKKYIQAHRYSLGLCVPLTPGLVVDHTCRNRACVNPKHLRQVNAKTNATENSISIPARNLAKTHCVKGHAYDETNTIIRKKGNRGCRECKRIQGREYKARNKESIKAYGKLRYARIKTILSAKTKTVGGVC